MRKSIATYFIGILSTLITYFVASIFGYFNRLDIYGEYVYIFSLINIFSVVSLIGFDMYIISTDKSPNLINNFFWYVKKLKFLHLFLLLITFLLIYSYFENSILAISVTAVVTEMAILKLIHSTFVVDGAVLKSELFNKTIPNAFKVVLVVYILVFEKPIINLFVLFAAVNAIYIIVLRYIIKDPIDAVSPKIKLSALVPFAIISTGSVFYLNIDKVILKYFVSSLELGIYSFCFQLSLLVIFVNNIIGLVMVHDLNKRDERMEPLVIFIKYRKFGAIIGILLTILILASFPVYCTRFGLDHSSFNALSILMISAVVQTTLGPSGMYLQVNGLQNYVAKISAFTCVGLIILIPLLSSKFGIVGSSVGFGLVSSFGAYFRLKRIYEN